MKRIVIFDMGGVLVDLDVEACKAAFRDELGYRQAATLIDACHQKGIVGDLEEGIIEADEFRRMVLAESRPDAVADDVDKAFWKILSGIEPYKAELLNRMAERYDLYMLSNNNQICVPRAAAMFAYAGAALDTVFKKCFFSFEMKALKPAEKFYRSVVSQIGADPSSMLFIDDSKKNVEGALASGLPAVYYEPGTDLSAMLAEVLGDPSLRMEV